MSPSNKRSQQSIRFDIRADLRALFLALSSTLLSLANRRLTAAMQAHRDVIKLAAVCTGHLVPSCILDAIEGGTTASMLAMDALRRAHEALRSGADDADSGIARMRLNDLEALTVKVEGFTAQTLELVVQGAHAALDASEHAAHAAWLESQRTRRSDSNPTDPRQPFASSCDPDFEPNG